jgi:hypothetical protein
MAKSVKFNRRDFEDVVFNSDKKRKHKSDRISERQAMRKELANV